ncbi:hypothetical protein AC1031_013805 [Aphanomyces cochlioides]|nr:hypothetical protein AC1031_013805 [Aphanomyces cochlioides]
MQNPSSNDEEFEDESPFSVTPPQRKSMAVCDDIIMLNEIVFFEPWPRKRNDTSNTWNSHTDKLTMIRGFGVQKDGKAIRKRFETILSSYKKGEMESLRKSRTNEEYDERRKLITVFVSHMDDYEQSEDVSGDIVRKLALNSISNRGNDDDDNSDVELTANKEPLKRKNKTEGRVQKKRKTRREGLDTLMRTIVAGLNAMTENDNDNDKIQRERLEFDREEAKQSRERHAALMAVLETMVTRRD